ncbi:MAG: DUF4956 domain-containing protein [Clostridia bacterium]|nr:DUF4956 domain-containing protein [Clostridia bacterium]MBR2176695.1 DUF4956 domain-containing protein [Clostridia bacterium]
MDFLTSTIFENTSGLNIGTIIIAFAVALILGIAISATYMLTHDKEFHSKSHALTLVMLPPIISIIVALVVPVVGSNLASAFSIAGVFTIIRFRSAPAEPRDVAYVAFALAAGLSCGLGFIYIGIIFSVLLIIVLFVLRLINFAQPSKKVMMLKITVPEDLNFEGAFDEVLNKYTTVFNLQKVRTADFGSLFELSYKVTLRDNDTKKAFIDELRTINGNLNIILTQKEYDIA